VTRRADRRRGARRRLERVRGRTRLEGWKLTLYSELHRKGVSLRDRSQPAQGATRHRSNGRASSSRSNETQQDWSGFFPSVQELVADRIEASENVFLCWMRREERGADARARQVGRSSCSGMRCDEHPLGLSSATPQGAAPSVSRYCMHPA